MKGLRPPLATRVTILYALIGGLWILLSDRMVAAVFRDPAELTIVQTYKGWLFVLATGLVLFTYLARENKIRNTSEQEFSNIFEHAVEGIFQSTLEGRFIRVNSAMARLYGYDSPSEMISTITDIGEQIQVNVKTREQFTTSLLQNGFVERFEAQSCRKDSSLIWTSTNARLVRDENGAPLYFEGFVTDITSNKLAETALKDAEIRYRDLVEQMPAAVYTDMPENNLDDGIYISPQIETISGYPPEAWMNRQGFRAEVLHPDDLERFVKENDRTNVTGEPFDIEYRIIAGDGRIVWIHDMARLVRNAEGKPLYWQGLMLDITENKTTEQQIKASEDQYRRLVEHSPYAIAVHSKGSLVFVNQAGVKLIGAKNAEELLGTPIMDFVHPDSRPDVTKRFQEMREGKEAPPIEEKFVRRDGSTIPVEAAAYPFTYQNKPAIQVFIRDLTEQKQAEAAIRASEERFSKTFHASPIPICITTLEKGVFLDVNEAYIKLTKWSREELIGHTTEELKIYLPGERKEFVDKLVNKRIVQGEVKKFITATDEVLEAGGFYELIELGGQACILSMFYDMTEQKQTREIIHANEEKLRAIVEHTQNIYYSYTTDRMLTYMSGQTKTILGYEPEEALVKWQNFITDHPINQRGIELAQRAIDTGVAQEPYILELKAKDGKHIWVEVRESPVVRDGSTVAIVGALTDITDRKKAEEDLERRLAELTVLHAVATAGSQSNSEDDVIERTTQIVNGMLYPENCGVLLLSHTGNTLKPHPSYRGVAEEGIIAEFPLSMGITGRVASTGQLARINDVGSDPAYIKTTEGIGSELCVPIRVNKKIIGVFNAESRKEYAFDEEDERVLITIAGALGTAIERIRLEEEERRRSKIIEALADIANVIATTRDTKNALDEIARRSIILLKASHVAIYLLQEDGATLRIATAHGSYRDELLSHSIKLGQGITGDIAARGKSEIINDTAKDPRRIVVPGTPENDSRIETLMSAALILHGKPIGAINAWRLRSDGLFNESELNFLNSIAHQASIAIDSGHLYDETVRRAEESKAIAEVGREISATLQPEIVLKRIATYAKDLLRAETSAVYLAEPNEPSLWAVAAIGKDAEEVKADPVTIGTGILGNIAMNKVGEIVNRASSDSRAIVIKGTEVNPLEHIMGAAVLSKDRLTGLLVVWRSGEGQEFRSPELDFLTGLAQQAAVAIENARLFNAEQKQRREAENLREATAALTKTIELEKLYEVILDSLSKLATHVSASIEMVDGEHVEIVAARGLPENDHFIGKTSPLRAGQWESDIKSPIIIADAQSDERFEKIQGTEYIRGWMSIPMIAQDKLIGYLNVDSDIVGFYTEEQAAPIQIFANQAATAIENARRFQSEKRRRTEAENLQVAATAITSSLDVEEVLQTILVALKHVTPYDSASMLLLEGDQVRIRAAKGLPKPDLALNQLFPASNALLRAIQKSGRPVIVQDAQKDPRFEKWAAADNVHGWLGVPLIARGQIIGYITLDSYTECAFDEHDAALAQTFAHQAAAVIDNANLFQSLQATNDELSKAYDTTLEGWGKALELRDKETQGHTKRVKDLTVRLARQIGIREPELTHIRRGVLVHDIGKMGVRDSILHKKGRLTKKEWEEMRRHPHHAFDLLYPIPYLRPSLDIAYCHHERWDGTGYPRGLKGEEIPLAARIFAVVDVWDALLSDRPYRKAWTKKKVEKHIRDRAGTHFDPQIVKAFLRMIERNGRK